MGLDNSKLNKATMENTPEWNLSNRKFKAKVLKVYDGDTLWAAICVEGKVYRMKIRLAGIDTPEMKPPKDQKNRNEEIKKAKEAKKYLEDLINNKIVIIQSEGLGKYGRLLGKIFLKQGNFCFGTKSDRF